MEFDYVSWEAFATILTGVLAVGAATFVGLRQHQTIRRQADIQALALNASLFDRRMVIVAAFGEHANALKWRPEELDEARRNLAEKSREAAFLFPAVVMEIIDDAWSLSTKIGSCGEAMRGEAHIGNKDAIAQAYGLDGLLESFKRLDERFYAAVSPVMTLHAIR